MHGNARAPLALAGAGLHDHEAAVAWRAFNPAAPALAEIERLQKKAKGQVYRLCAAAADGSHVIAKHATARRVARERMMYERVLPLVAVERPRYYGVLAADDGTQWLFVEDTGREQYSSTVPEQRAAAAAWLAALHTSPPRELWPGVLPDRGAAYYLQCVQSGSTAIRQSLTNSALSAEDLAVLERILTQSDALERRWNEIADLCRLVPSTLVHGDFAPKNIGVRRGSDGVAVLPFDWASAGWGTIAVDLAQSPSVPASGGRDGSLDAYWAYADLDVYFDMVRARWPTLDRSQLDLCAALGRILRSVVCVALEAPGLTASWTDFAMADMRRYEFETADAMARLGCTS